MHEPGAPIERQSDARLDVEPIAVDALDADELIVRPLEARPRRIDRPRDRALQLRLIVEVDLGQSPIRFDHIDVEALEVLHPSTGRPTVARIDDLAELLHFDLARRRETAAEIAEVVEVADLGGVDSRAQVAEVAQLMRGEQPTIRRIERTRQSAGCRNRGATVGRCNCCPWAGTRRRRRRCQSSTSCARCLRCRRHVPRWNAASTSHRSSARDSSSTAPRCRSRLFASARHPETAIRTCAHSSPGIEYTVCKRSARRARARSRYARFRTSRCRRSARCCS